jgi:phosphoglycolate phosphatase
MQTVLFDLDGTLIDHFTAIHSSIAYAQNSLGAPVSDYETVRLTVGGSLPVTLSRLMGEEKVESALPYFHEHFNKVMFDEVSILPGAEWLLAALYEKGFQLAVFTNKFGHHARAIVEHLKLDRWLTATVGTQDTPYRKPDPQFTDHILERLNADPSETCLVGDSPFDFQAAQIRNIPAYLVATGTHSTAALTSETSASAIFENLFDLGIARFDLRQPSNI